jgi:hypothetical protein
MLRNSSNFPFLNTLVCGLYTFVCLLIEPPSYMFRDYITVSCLLFFLIYQFIWQNFNVLVISRFQWLISAEGEIT